MYTNWGIPILHFVAGLEDFCLDLEFAIGRRMSIYWRFCWVFLSPVSMLLVIIYAVATMGPVQYSQLDFPIEYVVAGWSLLLIGVVQLPIWYVYSCVQSIGTTSGALTPNKNWGPSNPEKRIEWLKYKEEAKQRHRVAARNANHSGLRRNLYLLFGKYWEEHTIQIENKW